MQVFKQELQAIITGYEEKVKLTQGSPEVMTYLNNVLKCLHDMLASWEAKMKARGDS